MKKQIMFDDSLPEFVDFLLNFFSAETITENLFLRDPIGKLTFVVKENISTAAQRAEFSKIAAANLSPYIDGDGFGISTPEELFDDSLADSELGWRQQINSSAGELAVRLLDRRVLGGAWLQRTSELISPPRLVFASLKGGVGRSTALCVLAASLAEGGTRVLAIDMDVEAPGIGSMLLSPETLPKFGLLDYLVESSLGNVDDDFLAELISPSWLAGGRGIVSILPALGKSSLDNPQNVLSKISRAYLDTSSNGDAGITGRMQSLLARLSNTKNYDIILIDSRAGLHETTGSALLGLGGKVLLFGTDQPQTLAAFDVLFSNLALAGDTEWSERITLVQAKSSSSRGQNNFAKSATEVFLSRFTRKEEIDRPDLKALQGIFKIEWDENESGVSKRTAPLIQSPSTPPVVAILESEIFRDFDPLKSPDSLTDGVYTSVFGAFLKTVTEGLEAVPRSVDGRE